MKEAKCVTPYSKDRMGNKTRKQIARGQDTLSKSRSLFVPVTVGQDEEGHQLVGCTQRRPDGQCGSSGKNCQPKIRE